MTVQETINTLKQIHSYYYQFDDDRSVSKCEAIMCALSFIEKQKPVKPISYYHGLDRSFTYGCGHCFHSLKENDYFCSGCGKGIDWE